MKMPRIFWLIKWIKKIEDPLILYNNLMIMNKVKHKKEVKKIEVEVVNR